MPDHPQRDAAARRDGAKSPVVQDAASRDQVAAFSGVSRATIAGLNGLIWIYQHTLSPALAVAAPSCGCRFAPTCSHYAQDALREHGVLVGLALAVRRLAKCGPWHPGGLDPVPPRRHACQRVKAPARAAQPQFPDSRSLPDFHRSLS
jgi:uncharacterized protein